MTQDAYKVTVAKDLEDLIPVFLKNRAKEVESLRVAIAASDFEQLRQIGHRMKGVGTSYGFPQVSEIGKGVEEGARSGNRASLDACVRQYADFLDKVQITYE